MRSFLLALACFVASNALAAPPAPVREARIVSPAGQFMVAPRFTGDGRLLAAGKRFEGLFELPASGAPIVVATGPGVGFGWRWELGALWLRETLFTPRGREDRAFKAIPRADGWNLAAAELLSPGPGRLIPPQSGGAFVWVDEQERLHLRRGADDQILPAGEGYGRCAMAPDGESLLAHHRSGEIRVISRNGAIRQRFPGECPSWARDGRAILFMRSTDDGHTITCARAFLWDRASGAEQEIVAPGVSMLFQPELAPDGHSLAWYDPNLGQIWRGTLP